MNLTVYLTNDCNMGCGYCSVAVNQGPASVLDASRLHKALDFFIDEAPGKEKEVTFTGGEPLMSFTLLRGALEHLKKRGGASAMVLTNGTLLEPARLKTLLDLGARVVISLDGAAKTNDPGRVFVKGTASTYAAVAKRLEALPKDRLHVQMTVTPKNVGGFAEGVKLFYEQGFRSIHFTPEFFSVWDAKALKALEKQLKLLDAYVAGLIGAKAEPFRSNPFTLAVGRLQEGGPGAWWKTCDTLVLGDDAHFYSCHSSQMSPKAKVAANRVGDAASGFDWKRWEAGVKKAGDFLDTVKADYKEHVHCPMLFYHSAKVNGGSAVEAVQQADAVAKVFSGGLKTLAARLPAEWK